MINHICVYSKAFTNQYVEFVKENFIFEEHNFLIIYNDLIDFKFLKYKNVIYKKYSKWKLFSYLFRYLSAFDKVIIHGLGLSQLILILAVMKRNLKNYYWLIWGGDLYNAHWNRNNNLKTKILYIFRKSVIKKMGNVITLMTEEHELVKEWYSSNPRLHLSFSYPSNIATTLEPRIPYIDGPKNIMLGHSASRDNKHLEYFDFLSTLDDIKVYSILSYGDENYRSEVIKEGKRLLNDRFVPVTNYLTLDDYNNFLNEMDVIIFPADRQIGFGNLVNLVALGKKIYLNENVATKLYFHQIGVETYSVDDMLDLLKIDQETLLENSRIIKSIHNLENLIYQWNEIFNT